MSDNSFERAVADKLRALPDTFTYHPPDDPRTRQWKPCDFIVCRNGKFTAIECKEIQGDTFPLSRWSPQQRGHANAISLAGANYWLVVRFMPSSIVIGYRAAAYSDRTRGSLGPFDGMHLGVKSFDIEKVITY
jgi:hypothetical protein